MHLYYDPSRITAYMKDMGCMYAVERRMAWLGFSGMENLQELHQMQFRNMGVARRCHGACFCPRFTCRMNIPLKWVQWD